MLKILDASPVAMRSRQSLAELTDLMDKLPAGKSIAVPTGTYKEATLRSTASRMTNEFRRFSVIKHTNGTFEVACVWRANVGTTEGEGA